MLEYYLLHIIPYLLFFVLFFLSLKARTIYKSSKGYLFTFIVLFLFSSFRFDVGWDYATYVNSFMFGNKEYFAFNNLEPFNKVLLNISVYLKFYQLYFIITSFITIYFIYITLVENSSDFAMSALFFVSFPLFYLQSFSVVRQFVAIALIFWGLKYLFDKNILKFIAIIIISTLFHYSSLICLLFILILYLPKSRIFYVLMFLSSFLLSSIIKVVINIISADNLIFRKLLFYVNSQIGQGFGLMVYVLLFFAVLNFLFWNKLAVDKRTEFYLIMYSVGMVLYNLFSPFGHIGPRLSMYFLMPILYILPHYKKIFTNKSQLLFYYLYIYSNIALFLFTFYVSSNAYYNHVIDKDQFFPYKIFINKDFNSLR